MGSTQIADRIGANDPGPTPGPAKRLSTWTMTRDAITGGFHADNGFLSRARGYDIVRFRCGGRRFVSVGHPHYVDHVLYEARSKYVKSNEYELIRAGAGINLFTDEGESWAAHRAVLNPVFARRHLGAIADLMIDPIIEAADRVPAGELDLHSAMVQTTLRVVGNTLFGHDFGPWAQLIHDLGMRGHRKGERLLRLGLWGVAPRPVYETVNRLALSGVRLPPPLRDIQEVVLTLDRLANAVIDRRLVHPTDSGDLLDVLLRADGGTWSRRRIRDHVLTFIIAGHETTADAMCWFWYLMARNADARDRMLAEIDDVLCTRRPSAHDLARLPWTTACLQESQRLFAAVWVIARRAVEDDVVGGHHIRRGTTVFIPIHHIHHDPRWWPDPETFDPGRFLQGAANRPRSAYLAFGGGRRVCIGQSFALMEMTLIAAIMSQRFTFDPVRSCPVELQPTLMRRPKNGMRVIAGGR